MIYIKNFSSLGSLSQYDEIWAIVRSMKPQKNIIQVQDLSPSKELFFEYCRLKNDGLWNKETFTKIYLPKFMQDIHHIQNRVMQLLGYLIEQDKLNKNIALVCFCKKEELCHRSIIAGILQGMKAKVCCENDYSAYYELFSQFLSQKKQNNTTPSFRGEKYFLSNMYPCPITVSVNGNSVKFKCAETVYQATKCYFAMKEGLCTESDFKQFFVADGYEAKRLSHKIKAPKLWKEYNLNVMCNILITKFSQNPDLFAKLCAVQGIIAEENTWGDRFWGVCDGEGENYLGKILMKIRDGKIGGKI